MTAFSDYLENELLDHVLINAAFTAPATVYAALFTAVTQLETNNPTAEVSGGAYARVAISGAAAFSAAAAGTTDNGGDITFAQATANWGTVTHVAIVDHLTNTNWGVGVNVLFWGTVSPSKVVNNGDTFKFATGDLDVTLD